MTDLKTQMDKDMAGKTGDDAKRLPKITALKPS